MSDDFKVHQLKPKGPSRARTWALAGLVQIVDKPVSLFVESRNDSDRERVVAALLQILAGRWDRETWLASSAKGFDRLSVHCWDVGAEVDVSNDTIILSRAWCHADMDPPSGPDRPGGINRRTGGAVVGFTGAYEAPACQDRVTERVHAWLRHLAPSARYRRYWDFDGALAAVEDMFETTKTHPRLVLSSFLMLMGFGYGAAYAAFTF